MSIRRFGPAAFALVLAGCFEQGPPPIQGYVEGDFVDLGAPTGGRVEAVNVTRGGRVAAGDEVFRLDAAAERAALAQAEAERARATATYENLLSGDRPEEIAVIAAQRDQAAAARRLAETELARQRGLRGTSAELRARLDAAAAEAAQARARVAELDARLAAARLAARDPEIVAARAAAEAAGAALDRARVALADRAAAAPADARVEDVLFQPGEVVAAGQPVARLLPPGNVSVRAYLGAADLGRLPQGSRVALRCAGCPDGATATVAFVSAEAAYAPPILYSRDNRAKLAFLVELKPDAATAARLRPGQPVEIAPP
ncbi:conserved exported hypothetical protein [uncultured Alphaproteobacteria bacterium]|uniref:Uncharacterized protein n=1 Tax=uncultured Alphaproteobacteria bacterium TaxID=91750 RepID=A0A212KMU4_9PROT|nr:conserved exported hypothetical protein [uncultured Alphaproteobacteria bacterium]